MEQCPSWEADSRSVKCPILYKTLSFIAVFSRARHWSLSWARPILSEISQSVLDPLHIILSSMRRSLPFRFCKLIFSSRGVMGCDTVQCCGRIPTFRRTMLPLNCDSFRLFVFSESLHVNSGTVSSNRPRPPHFKTVLFIYLHFPISFISFVTSAHIAWDYIPTVHCRGDLIDTQIWTLNLKSGI
jgi:hypothetical protein